MVLLVSGFLLAAHEDRDVLKCKVETATIYWTPPAPLASLEVNPSLRINQTRNGLLVGRFQYLEMLIRYKRIVKYR